MSYRDKHNYAFVMAFGEGQWKCYKFKCKHHGCKKTYNIFQAVFWSTRS